MPRPTNNTASRKVRVASADVANSLSRSATPQSFSAQSNTMGELANALGIAQPAIEDYVTKKAAADVQRAEVDSQTGQLQDDQSTAYNTAATQLRAEADWVNLEPQLEETLSELDLENMTPTEVSGAIDQLYRDQYEGLEDPNEASVVLPLMEKFRAAKIHEYIERQKEIVFTNQSADLETLFSKRYDARQDYNQAARIEGRAEIPTDYVGFHAKIKSLNYGGKTTNELFYSIVANQAIANGDPELLENIPERWQDGTPSIAHIPAFNERLLNAKVRAEAKQLSNIKASITAQEKVEKENLRQSGISLVENLTSDTLSDTERDQLISDYSVLPGATPSTVIAMYNASKSFRDDGEKRAVDYDAVTLLTHKVFEGSAGAGDIFTAYAEGSLGEVGSSQALTMFRQLSKDIQDAERLSGSGDKDKFNAYLKGLSGKFVPSGLLSETNGAVSALKSDAEFAYRKYVFEDDLPPSEAFKKAVDEFLPQLGNAQGTFPTGGTISSKALTWLSAEGTERQAIAKDLAATDNIEGQINSLITTNVITEDQAIELLTEIANQL